MLSVTLGSSSSLAPVLVEWYFNSENRVANEQSEFLEQQQPYFRSWKWGLLESFNSFGKIIEQWIRTRSTFPWSRFSAFMWDDGFVIVFSCDCVSTPKESKVECMDALRAQIGLFWERYSVQLKKKQNLVLVHNL